MNFKMGYNFNYKNKIKFDSISDLEYSCLNHLEPEYCSNVANFRAAIFVASKSNGIYTPSEYAYFHLKAQRHHLGWKYIYNLLIACFQTRKHTSARGGKIITL